MTDENITIDTSPIHAGNKGWDAIDDAAGINSEIGRSNTSLSGPMDALLHRGRTLYKKLLGPGTEEEKIASASEILDFFRRSIFKPFAKDKKPRGGAFYRYYEADVRRVEEAMSRDMNNVLGPAHYGINKTFESTNFIDIAVKEIVKNINEGKQPAKE